jgi:DNA recombination protein RmuC
MDFLSIFFVSLIFIFLGIISFLIFDKKNGAPQMVKPLEDRLKELDEQIRLMDRYRTIESTRLNEELKRLHTSDQILLKETKTVLQALKKPDVRGFWGEVQLKKLMEASGMLPHTDFSEQQSIETETGSLRPDIIVKLPQKKHVVIDVKTPMEAYLEAMETEDPEIYAEKMTVHVRRIKEHIDDLKRKKYAKLVEGFEFVLLYLPTEGLFSDALKIDPSLLEYGMRQDVLIVTPTSLIALLKTIALSWKEDRLRENLEQVRLLGQELHKRIVDATTHIQSMSKSLNQTVEAHNKFIGSLERRVLVTARKFEEMGAASVGSTIRTLEELEILAKEPVQDSK